MTSDSLKNVLKSIKQVLQTQIGDNTSELSLSTNIEILLNNGIAEFWYWKEDGGLRFAVGTRDKQIINEYTDWSWKGPTPVGTTPYFDIQRNEWRSFIPNNFIKTTEFTPKEKLYD